MKYSSSLFTLFLSILSLSGLAQISTIEMELLTKNVTPLNLNIYCDSIIDLRPEPDKLWDISINLNGTLQPVKATLKGGDFIQTLQNHLNNTILAQNGEEHLIFVLREFNIFESTSSNIEQSTICIVEFEFIEQQGDSYLSYGIYHSIIRNSGVLKLKLHQKNINAVLRQCIINFTKERAIETVGIPILLEDLKIKNYDFTTIPPVGHYASFRDLLKGKPNSDFQIKLKKTSSQNLNNYRLKPIKGIHKKNKELFISDGEQLYLNASYYSDEYHYTMVKHSGKYIFFEDKVTSTGATVAFGLTGAALSNKLRAIVLDTSTGMINVFNARALIKFLKNQNHQDILEVFENSKQKHEDIEKAFLMLNAKF